MSSLDISAIKLGALQISTKGAKSIPVSLANDKSVFLQAGPLTPQFEPSALNDAIATRVNLCLSLNDEVEATLSQIDAHIVKLLVLDSPKLFGMPLNDSQVRERMQPSIRISEKGFRSWRMKMNLSGRNCVQLYDVDRQNLAIPPQSWVGCAQRARPCQKRLDHVKRDRCPLRGSSRPNRATLFCGMPLLNRAATHP